MNKITENKTRFFTITGIVIFAVLLGVTLRLIPDRPMNFTPIAAMALFGGAMFTNKKLGIIIPLAALFISDLFFGFHSTMWAVYGSFIAIGLIGIKLSGNASTKNIVLGSLAGSGLFFIVTNFAVWLTGFYPMNVAGLMECYTMAIPFFRNTILGDLFFNGVLFGAFAVAKRYSSRLALS